MIRQSTVDLLRGMRFSGMASELERQLSDSDSFRELSFDDRLAMLVDAEWNRRQAKKYKRCLDKAKLSIPNATVEGIEYYEDRKLSKKNFTVLSTCKYIEDEHHIIFKGASGNGKTYLACALGEAACRKHLSVRYIRMPELLDELCYDERCLAFLFAFDCCHAPLSWLCVKIATGAPNYHISLDMINYSVSYEYIKQTVDVYITCSTIETFFDGNRTFSYRRLH